MRSWIACTSVNSPKNSTSAERAVSAHNSTSYQVCVGKVPTMLGTRLFKNGIGCKGTSFTKEDLGSVF